MREIQTMLSSMMLNSGCRPISCTGVPSRSWPSCRAQVLDIDSRRKINPLRLLRARQGNQFGVEKWSAETDPIREIGRHAHLSLSAYRNPNGPRDSSFTEFRDAVQPGLPSSYWKVSDTWLLAPRLGARFLGQASTERHPSFAGRAALGGMILRCGVRRREHDQRWSVTATERT